VDGFGILNAADCSSSLLGTPIDRLWDIPGVAAPPLERQLAAKAVTWLSRACTLRLTNIQPIPD
jgi:hypothetical protein